MAPKYDILHSFVTLVKLYYITEEDDDDKPLKTTYQSCNGFAICSGKSLELIYITFIHASISTLGPYPEELVPEIYSFSGLKGLKCITIPEYFERSKQQSQVLKVEISLR